MEYQLRRYQIAPGKLDEFVEGWTSGVVPLREQFGFRVRGAWSIPESSEFVWIISYDGPDGLAAADAKVLRLERTTQSFTQPSRPHRRV